MPRLPLGLLNNTVGIKELLQDVRDTGYILLGLIMNPGLSPDLQLGTNMAPPDLP